MDFSHLYINMCFESSELQNIAKNRSTDFSDIFYSYATEEFNFGSFYDECDTWLPRQDQLQELLNNSTQYTLCFNKNLFKIEVQFERNIQAFYGNSAESCYLQAIMMLKYNKIWIDLKWIYLR